MQMIRLVMMRIDALNDLAKRMGEKTTYSLTPSGWVREHNPETKFSALRRIHELPKLIERRQMQLGRMQKGDSDAA